MTNAPSFIAHPSALIFHPSAFILHPSSFILHEGGIDPSSFILHPSAFMKRALTWLLYAAIPAAVSLQFMHASLVAQFILSCIAVLPLAAWIGASTEHLAHRMG